ncbi:hypothetical protein QEZ54_27940 [Catellatospora sp. KI3]|uniref:hypothetical protein n=1 Tax=Catellatospora sp. KI3 TaxID=3041620 RepID=UPI0024828651|nr:hypothetical protein [Catellatospora sp. KI3]MDI1464808.1 hypothetical protein [Catellatospora sp. KI3]
MHALTRFVPGGSGDAHHLAYIDERRARARLRRALRAAVRDPFDPDIDIVPYRHRHTAHWYA